MGIGSTMANPPLPGDPKRDGCLIRLCWLPASQLAAGLNPYPPPPKEVGGDKSIDQKMALGGI